MTKEKTQTEILRIDMKEDGYCHQGRASVVTDLMKRTFDIVGSMIGLVVSSPALLLIYGLIKHEDHGPAIFKQERIGYKGRPFTLYKFRSMTITSEADGKPALCQKDDERLTKIGKFLREHHLDELPQLWNVLKGEMSFVGPRPERKYFIDQIRAVNPDYDLLYQLRPGLFSPATLYNGYTTRWRKCSNDSGWTSNTCGNGPCGWTSRSSS